MSKNNAAKISHFCETKSQHNCAKSLEASSLKHSANSLSGPAQVHFYSSITATAQNLHALLHLVCNKHQQLATLKHQLHSTQ